MTKYLSDVKRCFVESVLKELEKQGDKLSIPEDVIEQKLDSLFNNNPELEKAEEELFGESANVLSEALFSDKLKKFAALVAFCLLPMLSSGTAEAALVHAEDSKNTIERAYLADGDSLFDQIAAFEKGVGEHQSLDYLSASKDYFEKEARSYIGIDKNTDTVIVNASWKATDSDWGSLKYKNKFNNDPNFRINSKGDLEYSRTFKINDPKDLQALEKFMKFNKASLSNNKSTLKKAKLLKKKFDSNK